MKKHAFYLLLMLVALSSQLAFAEFSTSTHQAPPSVVLEAVKDADGNAIITWTDGLEVVRAEHYIGHGKKGGTVKQILVGANKKVILEDLPKNGGRFNLQTTDGLFLHVECGNNPNTTMPTLRGIRPDCSYHGEDGQGPAEGALVVE